MNYELAKKLKDAGFPFKEHDDDHINEINGGLGYYATLSELIEACGDNFATLIHDKNKRKNSKWYWWSFPYEGIGARGLTPEEAVAKMWLKLNKK